MADEFWFSEQPIIVTGTMKQELHDVMNVSDFDMADVLLGVLTLSGTSITVRLLTGMSKQSEKGWVVAVTFTAQTSSDSWEKKHAEDLLKYLRWEVSDYQGGGEAAISLRGMLRRR